MRDAQMPGENITVYDQLPVFGGSMDAAGSAAGGYVSRSERELEPYMECLWDLCSKIPSLDDPTRTVLDETVDVNRELPIHSECRAIQNCGHIWEGVLHTKRNEYDSISKPGTGGCITVKDSGWEMILMLYDRDYFPNQRANNEDCLWGDGPFGERCGDYIKKPMAECTGEEILTEILYHFNLLDMKDEVLFHAYVSTCMMPYITSQFMPRTCTDRPKVVPDSCTNLGFIGQFVEVPGDVVFTVETAVRTPLEAVYQLTGLDKEIIEMNPAQYDMRYFKQQIMKFNAIKGDFTSKDLPKINPLKMKEIEKELLYKINHIPPYYIMYTRAGTKAWL